MVTPSSTSNNKLRYFVKEVRELRVAAFDAEDCKDVLLANWAEQALAVDGGFTVD